VARRGGFTDTVSPSVDARSMTPEFSLSLFLSRRAARTVRARISEIAGRGGRLVSWHYSASVRESFLIRVAPR